MEAKLFQLTSSAPLALSPPFSTTPLTLSTKFFNFNSVNWVRLGVVCRSKKAGEKEEQQIKGLPKEYYDDIGQCHRLALIISVQETVPNALCATISHGKAEWQARQREKTKELHRMRQEEEDEEERKINEYREIGLRLKDYPEEELRKVRKLVSSFIRSAEEVEEKIEEAAEKGELNELVLMVIWNRLDLARRDEEKDAIRSLDLLYRRVETEILKREATPAMRLLNDLLIMHDGFDDDGWLKACKKCMLDTFLREDPFSILVPPGFDIDKHEGPMTPPLEVDDVLLRVDFVREIDELLQEVRHEQSQTPGGEGFDPESVARRLKQQEKQKAIRQVEAILELAINLQW